MPLDPIPQLEEVEDVLDGLSSPTSLEVYEAILPFENDMVSAAIGKKTLEGGAGGPPSGAAGGVLGGTYPNPSFAADMATQAELDAHVNDATDAHAATAVAFTPAGTIAATTVQAAIEEVASEAGGGSVAAADVTVDSTTLVGTGTDAQAVFEELDNAIATNVTNIAAAVPKSLYDANTVLAANSDDTPAALTMGASTTLARLASGNIVAATAAEMRTLLDVPTTGEAVLDTLFDANTVLAATSDNTPAAVTMGASTILARLAAGNIVAATLAEIKTLIAPTLPGYDLGYAEITTPATSTATVEASATTVLTAPSVTFDGSTVALIQVYAPYLTSSAIQTVKLNLWEDSTNLGALLISLAPSANQFVPVSVSRRLTPTSGAKVYTVRVFNGAAATATLGAGVGGAGAYLPAFIRVSRAV